MLIQARSSAGSPLRFASETPKNAAKSPFEGFKGFSSANDPELPPLSRWRGLRKFALIAGLAGSALLGVWHFGAWQRDPIMIQGRYFNPRHQDQPDIAVSRVYTLPQSKRPMLVDLVLFAEPVGKNKSNPLEMMPPSDFVQGVRGIVRWEHFTEIRPKMEALMASAEARFGPDFTTQQFKTLLREPWTDASGKTQAPLWRKPIAQTTINGIPFALTLENIEVAPYQGFPPGLHPSN